MQTTAAAWSACAENRHIHLHLNKALSEETRHLDLDAKHNPMLGWLLPWGARRLRFNGDTQGMTLSLCSIPSLHTTSPLLLFNFFSPTRTCKYCPTHTQVCVHFPQTFTRTETHCAILDKSILNLTKLADEVYLSLSCKLIKLLSRWWFFFSKDYVSFHLNSRYTNHGNVKIKWYVYLL